MADRLSLEDPAYVSRCKVSWTVKPVAVEVVEFYGQGDPAFGGNSDDRPLGTNGSIVDPRSSVSAVAQFPDIDAAHNAAQTIPNRRPGSILGAIPIWMPVSRNQ